MPREYGVAIERSKPLRLPQHADARSTRSFGRWARETGRPLALDLFCGAGGLSLGLEDAGYTVVLSVDHDPWALETHRHNLPGVALDLDLSNPERVDSLVALLGDLEIDLVAGGPPCQPFSRAGRAKLRSLVERGVREVEDKRAGLWRAFLEVVERVKPRTVLMENVPDMALGDDLAVLRIMTARLEAAGYEVESRLLDAWRYGVPQHRQRLILVGVVGGSSFWWPDERKLADKRVTVRDAISDLPRLRGSTGTPEMRPGQPQTAFQRRARRRMNGSPIVWDHVTRPVREDDKEAFSLLKPGMRYSELPERLRRYRDDVFNDKYNRLAWNDLSRSITAHLAKDGYWYIHPSELRTLTVREAARIQTFPDHFRFAGTRSHAFRQIGNAVPPLLAEVIGHALLRTRRSRSGEPSSSKRLAGIRRRLLQWAERDRARAPWRHPGEPWSALAGVVLGDRVGSDDKAVAEFLREFPSHKPRISTAIRKSARDAGAGTGSGYERMAKAAAALSRGHRWDSVPWLRQAGIGPQEQALVRLLGLGSEEIVPTIAALRVVARLTGSRVDEERSLSAGRMLLGSLIGIEAGQPRLNAALHALGRSLCVATEPNCAQCPLRRFCVEAR